jgi:hypothetical protein
LLKSVATELTEKSEKNLKPFATESTEKSEKIQELLGG